MIASHLNSIQEILPIKPLLARKIKAHTAEGRWMRKSPVWPSSCVTPAGTSNELDVQNIWEENTKQHTLLLMTVV